MNDSRIDTGLQEPSMLGIALNTLNGYRGSGEGHWLDNVDADILRDMVRIACKELAELLEADPDEDRYYWKNRTLDHATALDQERVQRIHAEAERDRYEAAIREHYRKKLQRGAGPADQALWMEWQTILNGTTHSPSQTAPGGRDRSRPAGALVDGPAQSSQKEGDAGNG